MEPNITDPNVRWHYDHCAFSWDPKTETPDVGRLRQAAKLAAAEAWFAALPREAKRTEWDEDPDSYDPETWAECPVPDEVLQLLVTVRLAPPPARQLRRVHMGQGIYQVYVGPAPADDEEREEAHVATFFDDERADDYVRQANATRTYTYSLGCIGMMHATQRADVRMYEAEAALDLLAQWEAS